MKMKRKFEKEDISENQDDQDASTKGEICSLSTFLHHYFWNHISLYDNFPIFFSTVKKKKKKIKEEIKEEYDADEGR